MKKSVCVLIVTYNRKNYLMKCFNAVVNQSYKPSKIIIFDNNSDDKTEEMLKENGIINDYKFDNSVKSKFKNIDIIYFKNSKNLGGSYGFHYGLDLARKQKCDYIWAMDDDVLPENNCLSVLIEQLKDKKVCIPNRTDDNYTDKAIVSLNMSNPFRFTISSRKIFVSPKKINEDFVKVVDMPFEGPIFETDIINKVGLPNKDLFIIFDDTEYAHRISKITDIYFIKDAILHKQIIPSKSKSNLMSWKSYYGYRNQYWFDRHYGKNIFVKKMRPFLNHKYLLLKSILKMKWPNIKIINISYYDGKHDILGKTVNPGKKFVRNNDKGDN